jgi:hypothetical protein
MVTVVRSPPQMRMRKTAVTPGATFPTRTDRCGFHQMEHEVGPAATRHSTAGSVTSRPLMRFMESQWQVWSAIAMPRRRFLLLAGCLSGRQWFPCPIRAETGCCSQAGCWPRAYRISAPGLTATRRISGSSHQNRVTTLNRFTPWANRSGPAGFQGLVKRTRSSREAGNAGCWTPAKPHNVVK